MSVLFTILGTLCSIYLLVCLIAIIITFIPGAKFTSVGKFLGAVTGPYLNFFKRFRKLIIENIDFSPVLALGVLSVLDSLFSRLAAYGTISFAIVLNCVIYVFWHLIFYILCFFGVLSLIRWIVLVVNRGQRGENPVWNGIDTILGRISYKLSAKFTKKPISYTRTLLITWVFCAVVATITYIAFIYLSYFIMRIPF